MWKFLLDEQIEPAIYRGLKRLYPELDVLTVNQANLCTQPDNVVLTWAAESERVLLSKDRATMHSEASQRIEQEQPMPGLLLIRRGATHGEVIRAVQLFIECVEPQELENTIFYIPI